MAGAKLAQGPGEDSLQSCLKVTTRSQVSPLSPVCRDQWQWPWQGRGRDTEPGTRKQRGGRMAPNSYISTYQVYLCVNLPVCIGISIYKNTSTRETSVAGCPRAPPTSRGRPSWPARARGIQVTDPAQMLDIHT